MRKLVVSIADISWFELSLFMLLKSDESMKANNLQEHKNVIKHSLNIFILCQSWYDLCFSERLH